MEADDGERRREAKVQALYLYIWTALALPSAAMEEIIYGLGYTICSAASTMHDNGDLSTAAIAIAGGDTRSLSEKAA